MLAHRIPMTQLPRLPALWMFTAFVVATLLSAAISAAVAQDNQSVEELQEQLKAGEESLAGARARQKKLETSRAAAVAEREDLTAQTIMLARKQQETERKLSEIENELAAIDERLAVLEMEEAEIKSSLSIQKRKISRLLAAMQRMGRNPPPVIITQRSDALSMVRSAMLLAKAVPELRGEALKLRATLDKKVANRREQESRRTEQAIKQNELATEKIRLDGEKRELDGLVEQKRQLIARYSSDLDTIALEAEKQARNVRSLSALIASLDKTVSERTDLGAYNRSLQGEGEWTTERNVAGLRPGLETPSSGIEGEIKNPASTIPELDRPSATLVPSATRMPMGSGRLEPAIQFRKAQGKLPLPTAGRLVVGYGTTTRFGRRSQGVVFETRTNARITSPADGWVVFAGTFRSYGQLLIINAGDDYHIVMAGLSRIDVQLGQFVLASEPVGAMGAAPASADGTALPVLYVEFRKSGKPIDPSPWWAQNQVVAQR